MPSIEDTRTIAEAAAFIRRERQRRGWTAQDFVERLVDVAASAGEELSLTQQAISFFETGKTKSFPRWLRHANLVFVEDDAVCQAELFRAASAEEFGQESDEDETESPEELEFLKLLRVLAPEDRKSLLQIARSLAQRFSSSPSVHAKQHTYRAERPKAD